MKTNTYDKIVIYISIAVIFGIVGFISGNFFKSSIDVSYEKHAFVTGKLCGVCGAWEKLIERGHKPPEMVKEYCSGFVGMSYEEWIIKGRP